MSDATKTADAPKKGMDQSVRTGHTVVEAAGRTTKDAIQETSNLAQNGVDRAKQAAVSMTDTVAETANAATNLSSKAVDQSREVMMLGVRTAAGVGSRVGDISFGRSHHFMTSAAQAMNVYRNASERSADRVSALFSSAMTLSRGLQDMQHAWLEMIDQTMERAAHKPQDLLRCKNLVELAEVQRDLYLDAINHTFESTGRLLDLAGRTAQDAIRPLRS